MNGPASRPPGTSLSASGSHTGTSLGEFPWSLSASELEDRATSNLQRAETELSELLHRPGARTVENFLEPLDRILLRVRDIASHGHFTFAVHSDEGCRTAGREASEAAERFFNGFRVNDDAYRALGSLVLEGADEPTRFCVAKMLREMRRSGVEKDAASRARLLELNNEIDRVANQYAENIAKLERTIEVSGTNDLAGLPPDFLATHLPGADGTIRITTRYPDFHPVMAYAQQPELRRRLLSEFMNRAYPENLPVLDQLLAQRYELATSLGYPAYSAYAIEDKMMERPEAVRTFLDRVANVLRQPATADLARFLARKREDEPSAERLELWDSSLFGEGYYDGKLRAEEFGVDTKLLRAYLPYGQVRDGLFALCEELFGVHFHRLPSDGLWHPSVEAYDVTLGNAPLGRFFLDLVPREGKFSHAACFGIRDGILGLRLPQSALVCNFLDATGPAESARMQYSDVITFFHEFGHLLHALFSGHGRWLYTTMSFIEWDFVEAPSQLFEEWARNPATLARFARNPDTGETIPADLLERLRAAEALGRSVRWLRQVALAAISLELYDRPPAGLDSTETFREVWARYFTHPLEPEYHPSMAWGHLTGYSAFYYTYVWSLVIARDLLRPFLEKGTLTDPETAARYAREILTPGSTRPASELVQAYLGREFDFVAFERWIREGLELSRPRPRATA
ncbi:MAG: Zn-dependent oligopeptidase [Thermoplasmata archaeon]|nr:Zn-dependent oligopeptidase [Thermoplasmata archaeon]